jgi:DNA-directed RNA polymerase sigma subunit (sigma70/sigma32)
MSIYYPPTVPKTIFRLRLKNAVASGELTALERRVLELRYGLYDDGRSKALDTVGAQLYRKREVVHEIERHALSKLFEQFSELMSKQ